MHAEEKRNSGISAAGNGTKRLEVFFAHEC